MRIALRPAAGFITGCIVALAIAALVRGAAHAFWPAYAAAEPEKAFSSAMLAARLTAGALAAAFAGSAATIIAKDNGKAAWWLGGLFLAMSLPIHLFQVWADYPVWYHIIYLSYLVPITGLAGRSVGSRANGSYRGGNAAVIG